MSEYGMRERLIRCLKTNGIFGSFIKFMNKITFRIFRLFNRLEIKFNVNRKNREKQKKFAKECLFLKNKVLKGNYKYIFVFYPYVEWNLPIFQRPQQIALELTKRNDVLYFFCTPNFHYDQIKGLYKKINENLYVVTDFNFICALNTTKRILHLYSTDIVSDYSVVEKAFERNDKVLYEYIDEIHEEITHSLPKNYLIKHDRILKNEKCFVVATADKLYNDVKKVRNKNFALSTNGVNLVDFIKNKKDKIPNEIIDIRSKYDKIICYYGSLAVWFDYELVKKIAKRFPKYAIVLIGLEYDDSYKKSNLDKVKNIYYLGKKDYYELHKYSENSDLLIIPFLINNITESTSPVKLFEYMATNVPILTTDMAECRKYKSVIIGKNHNDFLNKIDSTMKLINDNEYLKLEMEEAKENTWIKKANTLIDLLDGKE